MAAVTPEFPYKTLIQLTSSDERVYKSTIRQVHHLLLHFNNNIGIHLVCNGDSLPFCLANGNMLAGSITDILRLGVRISACVHMLRAGGKNAGDLVAGIGVVPSGVAELVIRQQEGWSYLRAGL